MSKRAAPNEVHVPDSLKKLGSVPSVPAFSVIIPFPPESKYEVQVDAMDEQIFARFVSLS